MLDKETVWAKYERFTKSIFSFGITIGIFIKKSSSPVQIQSLKSVSTLSTEPASCCCTCAVLPAKREGVVNQSSVVSPCPLHHDARGQIFWIDEVQHFFREGEQESDVGNKKQLGEGIVPLQETCRVEDVLQLEGLANLMPSEKDKFRVHTVSIGYSDSDY